MTELYETTDLLYRSGEPMTGSDMSDEDAMGYAHSRFPNGYFCLVREWTWLDIEVNEAQRVELARTRRQPAIIYAHGVVYDSQRRWDVGDFVRTSLLHAHEEGFHFRTLNSVYLLLEPGTRKRAAAETAAQIF